MSFFELDFDPTASENAPMIAFCSAVFSSPDILCIGQLLSAGQAPLPSVWEESDTNTMWVARVKAIRRKQNGASTARP